MRPTLPAAVALAAAAAVAGAVSFPGGVARAGDDQQPDAYERVLADFRKGLRKGTVESAAAAVELLDPNNPRSLPELLPVLAKGHWLGVPDALSARPARAS